MAIDRQQQPHFVIALLDKETGEIHEYRECAVGRDGTPSLQSSTFDHQTLEVKVIQEYPTRGTAMAARKKLASFSLGALKKEVHTLPTFDERLPVSPRERAAAFRAAPDEDKESIVYMAMVTSGLPLKKVADWLCVKQDEVTSVCADDVALAARAELELRLGKQLMQHALGSKSPSSMTACVYASKNLLGWSDQGPKDETNTANQGVDINVKVTTNDNPELNELRNELEEMVAAAEAKSQKRLQ